MVTRKRPAPPRGLGEAGRRLWRDTVAVYELRVDELRVLTAACGSLDVIAKLQAALAKEPATVTGSRGQTRPHPLLGELRAERLAFAVLAKQLHLLDDPGSERAVREGNARSLHARRAVGSRYQ